MKLLGLIIAVSSVSGQIEPALPGKQTRGWPTQVTMRIIHNMEQSGASLGHFVFCHSGSADVLCLVPIPSHRHYVHVLLDAPVPQPAKLVRQNA